MCRVRTNCLAHSFPGTIFYELPVDMVTQILNFGLPGAD